MFRSTFLIIGRTCNLQPKRFRPLRHMNLVASYFFLAGLEILPIAPSAVGVVSRRDPKIGPATMGFSPAPFRRAFFARQETNDKVSINAFSDIYRIFQYFRVLLSTNEHSQIVANGKSIFVVCCSFCISFLLLCSRTWQKPMISDSN